MLIWTLVILCLSPNGPPAAATILHQRHFATALACERSAEQAPPRAGERLVCLPSDNGGGLALAAAY